MTLETMQTQESGVSSRHYHPRDQHRVESTVIGSLLGTAVHSLQCSPVFARTAASNDRKTGSYNRFVDPHLVDEIAARHGIVLLLQFGSSVSGPTRPDSDVDLAVLLDDPPSLRQHADLAGDLQTLVTGRDVDVALINHADPLFLKQILGRCALLYGSTRRLHELRMYGFKRYQDHRQFLAMERDYVTRKLRALMAR